MELEYDYDDTSERVRIFDTVYELALMAGGTSKDATRFAADAICCYERELAHLDVVTENMAKLACYYILGKALTYALEVRDELSTSEPTR